jgi:hypothetical protein
MNCEVSLSLALPPFTAPSGVKNCTSTDPDGKPFIPLIPEYFGQQEVRARLTTMGIGEKVSRFAALTDLSRKKRWGMLRTTFAKRTISR